MFGDDFFFFSQVIILFVDEFDIMCKRKIKFILFDFLNILWHQQVSEGEPFDQLVYYFLFVLNYHDKINELESISQI